MNIIGEIKLSIYENGEVVSDFSGKIDAINIQTCVYHMRMDYQSDYLLKVRQSELDNLERNKKAILEKRAEDIKLAEIAKAKELALHEAAAKAKAEAAELDLAKRKKEAAALEESRKEKLGKETIAKIEKSLATN
jgi:hypothetical protein